MALVKLRPASELQSEIDSMINTFWGSPSSRNTSAWQPRVDIVENDESYSLFAEVPGMTREDIRVSVKEGVLILEGNKRPHYENTDRPNRRERFFGNFSRTFQLPDNVKLDDMSATYRDGILHLTVPKAEEAKPRQIEVQVE